MTHLPGIHVGGVRLKTFVAIIQKNQTITECFTNNNDTNRAVGSLSQLRHQLQEAQASCHHWSLVSLYITRWRCSLLVGKQVLASLTRQNSDL